MENKPITIRLINDCGISDADFSTIADAVHHYVPLVANAWNIPNITVINGGTPVDGDWLVYATEKNRSLGALGYHTFKAGAPVAYCSLKAVGNKLWGLYHRAMVIKGKTIRQATYSAGLVTVLCHEIAEMICDPKIATLSAYDKLNRNWLIEVADHVYGSYFMYKASVLPDITTPSFYDLNGKAPFSLQSATNAPFTMTPKGYGYWKDATGKLVKI